MLQFADGAHGVIALPILQRFNATTVQQFNDCFHPAFSVTLERYAIIG